MRETSILPVGKGRSVAMVVVIAATAFVNYLIIQAVWSIPCDAPESCNQVRVGGMLIVVTSDIFAVVIVVSELAKKR